MDSTTPETAAAGTDGEPQPSDLDRRAIKNGVIHTDLERRRVALDAALRLHGANALAVDVIETACEFYAWLSLPSKLLTADGAGALTSIRHPK